MLSPFDLTQTHMHHCWKLNRIMFFGKASFRAQKGRASAPRKALIREMDGQLAISRVLAQLFGARKKKR